jgi:hypothetical protein
MTLEPQRLLDLIIVLLDRLLGIRLIFSKHIDMAIFASF